MLQANQLSDRLDDSTQAGVNDGYLDDRVTKLIFKSARNKLERLIDLLKEDVQQE